MQDGVDPVVVGCRFGIAHHDACAGVQGDIHQPGCREHRQRCTDRQHEVTGVGGRCTGFQDIGVELLAEKYGPRFQDAAAFRTIRIGFSGIQACEYGFHARAIFARKTYDTEQVSVDFEDLFGARTGCLVQAVDILGDDSIEFAGTFEPDDRRMRFIGLHSPRGVCPPTSP